MNVSQLRKRVGSDFRLRPVPRRKAADGAQLPALDSTWRLEAIVDNPQRLRLISHATDHILELQPDNVREFRSPDFLILRCQLTLAPTTVELEPLVPATTPPGQERPPEQRGELNVPPRYGPKLNYHRFQLAREKAAKNPDGSYTYPVHVLGRDEHARAFSKEAVEQFGARCLITEAAGGVTDVRFTYTGALTPDRMTRLAVKHQLQIVQCGPEVRY